MTLPAPSRATVGIARTDERSQPYTELLTVKVGGDPQFHTHIAMPNMVLTDTGRVGSMDLDVPKLARFGLARGVSGAG